MTASTSGPSEPDESDIYDRQIRLWGAEAQSKMASAKVLYINVTGVSSEILKNLVLAGIQAAIADGRLYPDALTETPTSFLSPSERMGAEEENPNNNSPSKKRIRRMSVAKAVQSHIYELNPLLDQCDINEDDLDSVPSEYFSRFDIIVASNIGLYDATRISKAVTMQRKKFFLVHSFGYYACAMVDLGSGHTFRKEMGKDKLSDLMQIDPYRTLEEMAMIKLIDARDRWHKNGPPTIYVKYRLLLNYYSLKKDWPSGETFSEFEKLSKDFLVEQGLDEQYAGNQDDLKQLAITATAELSPVCAVIGGVLGNEVIKAISGKGEPANNILLFDGVDGGCKSFILK